MPDVRCGRSYARWDVAGRPVWTGHPLAVACVRWVLARLVIRCRTSGRQRSSGGCNFFGVSSSWFLYLVSSLARPLDVVAPWLSSKYLIMHSTHVGGSSHVSHVESEGSERSEFTLCPMAYIRGLVICPLGAWRVVGVYMGMNVGCSASSSPPPLGKIRPRTVILITMETVVVEGLVVGRS